MTERHPSEFLKVIFVKNNYLRTQLTVVDRWLVL